VVGPHFAIFELVSWPLPVTSGNTGGSGVAAGGLDPGSRTEVVPLRDTRSGQESARLPPAACHAQLVQAPDALMPTVLAIRRARSPAHVDGRVSGMGSAAAP